MTLPRALAPTPLPLADLLAYPIVAALRAEPHRDLVAIDIAIDREAAPAVAGRALLSLPIADPALAFEERVAIAARIVKTINGALLP